MLSIPAGGTAESTPPCGRQCLPPTDNLNTRALFLIHPVSLLLLPAVPCAHVCFFCIYFPYGGFRRILDASPRYAWCLVSLFCKATGGPSWGRSEHREAPVTGVGVSDVELSQARVEVRVSKITYKTKSTVLACW